MKTPLYTFTNENGRTFVVRYLPVDARYGRANCLVNTPGQLAAGHAMVEFYDATYADDSDGDYTSATKPLTGFGPLGQFVTRYNVDTILGEDKWGSGTGGLNLDGGTPVWQIDADTMMDVRGFLRGARRMIEAENAKVG